MVPLCDTVVLISRNMVLRQLINSPVIDFFKVENLGHVYEPNTDQFGKFIRERSPNLHVGVALPTQKDLMYFVSSFTIQNIAIVGLRIPRFNNPKI